MCLHFTAAANWPYRRKGIGRHSGLTAVYDSITAGLVIKSCQHVTMQFQNEYDNKNEISTKCLVLDNDKMSDV